MKRIATVIAATAIVVPMFAGIAQARPVNDNYQGNSERSNCQVTQVRDRGYVIEVKKVDKDGKVRWVQKRVKTLPDDVQFRIVKDRGITRNVVCQYK